MKKILITGGPVHAHLDAVKIITNDFSGGLIAELADSLAILPDVEITYLCKKKNASKPSNPKIIQINHDGFENYRNIVKEQTPLMDSVILGAAVANLIPAKPWKDKFPSHNYKEGDIIPIDFLITPRVINEIKALNQKVHLFGFKLLANVDKDYLIDVAYETLMDSKATAIIANDKSNLLQKYIVTKEKGVHPVSQENLAEWIYKAINDEYYRSKVSTCELGALPPDALLGYINNWHDRFVSTSQGFIFGTVAVRNADNYGFWTTGRGKKEINDFVLVGKVDHEAKEVSTLNGKKATLNAPLLDRIFKNNSRANCIVHFHKFYDSLNSSAHMLPYAPPGTVRDTMRDKSQIESSFHINEHGSFLLFDKNGSII